jgi:hypothetical protein
VGEAARVEINAVIVFLSPGQPAGKVIGFDFIARHLAVRFQIHGVQVEAVPARNEAVGPVEILAQLDRRAGFARVVAGGHDAAAQPAIRVFETTDIIALPAVQADRR